MIKKVKSITNQISLKLFSQNFLVYVDHDKIHGENGRIYLQLKYCAPCNKTGESRQWSGRKWYLSEFMTEDEIVKTTYGAFKMLVEHELMEGFKFDNQLVFNPHANFRALIDASKQEIARE